MSIRRASASWSGKAVLGGGVLTCAAPPGVAPKPEMSGDAAFDWGVAPGVVREPEASSGILLVDSWAGKSRRGLVSRVRNVVEI